MGRRNRARRGGTDRTAFIASDGIVRPSARLREGRAALDAHTRTGARRTGNVGRMDIDRTAPLTAEAGIEISADPDTVWRVLADFASWPKWNPDIKRVSLDAPAVEGTTLRWKAGPSTITSTVRSLQRPREIGWTGRTLGIRAVHVWHFQGDGHRTRATTAESWDGPLPRLLRGPLRKQLQAALDSGLRHLKDEAERQAGDGRSPGAR